jgi:1-acyl-sn-glycerol-3-phosphate acyltransferase
MYVCDYDDLIHPKPRKVAEAQPLASVRIEGAAVDAARSFSEVYASADEPKVPICITYHWKIFRAQAPTATLTVSDRSDPSHPASPYGQEQAINFLEIQPYHE